MPCEIILENIYNLVWIWESCILLNENSLRFWPCINNHPAKRIVTHFLLIVAIYRNNLFTAIVPNTYESDAIPVSQNLIDIYIRL